MWSENLYKIQSEKLSQKVKHYIFEIARTKGMKLILQHEQELHQ